METRIYLETGGKRGIDQMGGEGKVGSDMGSGGGRGFGWRTKEFYD